MKAPHTARYRVAYAKIAQAREALEREAAARAELEPYMRAVERLVAMQEDGPALVDSRLAALVVA